MGFGFGLGKTKMGSSKISKGFFLKSFDLRRLVRIECANVGWCSQVGRVWFVVWTLSAR